MNNLSIIITENAFFIAKTMLNIDKINNLIANSAEEPAKIREILAKAKLAQGLNLEDIAVLTTIKDSELTEELFATARQIKNQIYGNRIVIFAPLYISNLCANECLYCAFRATNTALHRRSLSQAEIATDVEYLINQGHKRILLVAGESHTRKEIDYILQSIDTIYNVKNNHGAIRRINVNIAPLSSADFKLLKKANIGTYQLFQETYDPVTYQKVHIGGKKIDYEWRLSAMERAIEAGIDDVGIGVLFGLADWRFELLALLQHAQYLDAKFGIGPHTISVPRLEPATGSTMASNPPAKVSDFDFSKIIAILRLAVPYTGIILSTRETSATRRKALAFGVSQISAGSKTDPGGYSKNDTNASQFALGDHRSLDEVIRDIAAENYLPSFCTACYRLKRTGKTFMDLAKNGNIKNMCQLNAIITFAEYLTDYASPATKKIGNALIKQELIKLPAEQQKLASKMMEKTINGERDVYI